MMEIGDERPFAIIVISLAAEKSREECATRLKISIVAIVLSKGHKFNILLTLFLVS